MNQVLFKEQKENTHANLSLKRKKGKYTRQFMFEEQKGKTNASIHV